jgi:hypothetical protein
MLNDFNSKKKLYCDAEDKIQPKNIDFIGFLKVSRDCHAPGLETGQL